jgi:hypothetical protein
MPEGPPNPAYFEDFPPTTDELGRLAAYRMQRIIDEAAITVERKRVAEAVFKLDLFKRGLGPAPTRAEYDAIGYSPYGTGSSCGY